jgi:hypothetical protein
MHIASIGTIWAGPPSPGCIGRVEQDFAATHARSRSRGFRALFAGYPLEASGEAGRAGHLRSSRRLESGTTGARSGPP